MITKTETSDLERISVLSKLMWSIIPVSEIEEFITSAQNRIERERLQLIIDGIKKNGKD